MPDVDLHALDRLAADIAVVSVDKERRTRCRRTHNRLATFRQRRVHAPEWSELARIGLGLTLVAVIEETDQSRKADRPGHQHRLVVVVVGVLADRIDVGGGGLELLLGQLHLTREIVQVPEEGRHDLAETRVGRAFKFTQYRLGDVRLAFDDHRFAPQLPPSGTPRGALYVIAFSCATRLRAWKDCHTHMRPSSRSSRRNFSGIAAAPGAALSRSRGASLAAR